MNHIIYPTIDFYIYNLVDGSEEFWTKNLPNEIGKLPLDKAADITNSDYVELLKLRENDPKNYYSLTEADKSKFSYPVQGFYYPVQMGDTYGILLDCSVDDKSKPYSIERYKDIKKIADEKHGNLGKNWVISGYLPSESDEQLKLLVKEICELLIPEDCQLNSQWGKFMDGLVFETKPLSLTKQKIGEENYGLIILYRDKSNMEKANNFYRDWMQMFCFRNKIIWAYDNAQQLKKVLERKFLRIEEEIPEIKFIAPEASLSSRNLEHLKRGLKKSRHTLYAYATGLSSLEVQLQTLETNLQNYQDCLKIISNKAREAGETDLKFLRIFSNTAINKYKTQIKSDIASLSPGLRMLENLTDTIRGIVEVEQAESDRRLENLIAAAGVGVGTASAAASSIANFVKEIREPQIIQKPAEPLTPPPPPSPWSNFWFAFFFSILIGAAFGIGTWLLLAFFRSWRYYKK